MQKAHVIVSAESEREALLEGVRRLQLEPEEAAVQKVDSDVFIVALKDAPGQWEVVVSQDKMSASIKFLTPPFGAGSPARVEDIERAIADLKIVSGIDRKSIVELIAAVSSTARTQCDVTIASGVAPKDGRDAEIELRIGRDALNRDPAACNIVRPGQVIAVKTPATKAAPGRNIFGKEIPAKPGADVRFSMGENVAATDEGKTLVSTTYGVAQASPTSISVSRLVEASPDRMWAQVPVFPTLADNGKLSLEHVMIALKQAGVVHGIRKDVLEAALTAGEVIEHLRVAEGTPAEDGIDARIDFKFKLSGEDPESIDEKRRSGQIQEKDIVKEIVHGGEVLAAKVPLRKPVEGRTVTGGVVKGAEAEDKKGAVGKGVALQDDGLTYVVEEGALGYANYVEGTFLVEDLLWISEDKMGVYLSVHPQTGSFRMLTAALIERTLATRGVVYGIDRESLELALRTATAKGVPLLDQMIAKGRPPDPGEDGRIEFKFDAQKSSGTIVAPDGQMDYRERHAIQNVKAGDVLAIIVPPAPGKEGMDVFGGVVPSEPGAAKTITPIGNVSVSEDGLTLIAEMDGVVTLTAGARIGVFKEYQVPGDVDFSTGNLTMDGSLDVKGWIRSGFTVRAKGEIRVGGGVEDAVVEAGADLYIDGGAIGSEQGEIHSGGDIRARFFENARIHAEGSISVRDYMFGCNAKAGGKVLLTEGKGRLRGGTVEAVKGLEVKELGAETALETHVAVGEDTSKMRKRTAAAEKALGDFREKREKIETVLARYVQTIKTKPPPRETLLKLSRLNKLRHRIALYETRLMGLKEELTREIARIDAESVDVKVENMVYSGTTVSVKGFDFYVGEDVGGKVRFVFNPEHQRVEILKPHR